MRAFFRPSSPVLIAAALGVPALSGPAGAVPDDHARIHYHRPDGNYAGWGLHVWEQTTESVTWTSPLAASGQDDYGVYWDVGIADGGDRIGFIIHKGEEKDPGPDQFLEIGRQGREVWVVSGSGDIHSAAPDVSRLALGDLSRSRAHWVDERTVCWDVFVPSGGAVWLTGSPEGTLSLEPDGVDGGRSFRLQPARSGLSAEARAKFPHLAGLRTFRISDDAAAAAPDLLRGQVAVSLVDADGKLKDATGVQTPGVLDALFTYSGPLGVTWNGDTPSFHVWAPTARSVRLHVLPPDGGALVAPMTAAGGVWSAEGRADWKNGSYLYEVEVFAPTTMRMETNLVTDPYSRGLTRNSARSLVVDLDDDAHKPAGWDALEKPALDAPEDIVLYELHVRDFSMSDPDVPDAERGTYRAFARDGHGTRHLRALADAGMTHVHLLPAFDIATVNEDRDAWPDPGDLSKYAPDSPEPQAAVDRIREDDGFNWGYDPFHYGVPEGSYSTDPDGPARIHEFREMVAALSGMGLRVIMDVVYNHTNAAGQNPKSVLDRIVPGYYHRLNAAGAVETSTCCQNTATEHAMMERLMLDDLAHWAVNYKVDGFRFDLMGHHMKRNLVAARDRLAALTPERDGVDGRALYLYGEGWDFGEVQGGKRGVNAAQIPMGGTGIGTFNDRIRDAVRGGNPFGDRREQGVATGLHVQPSRWSRSSGPSGAGDLRNQMQRTRTGLAGNLRARGGYNADPQENVLYVSAHDNETLFDKIQFAAAEDAPLEQRVRMQGIAHALVAFGQGVPFFHAGSELLRSKSMDRDSYDSGDWFNRLDFTARHNNWGVGLPIADKNQERWNVIGPLLADPALNPSPTQIAAVRDQFLDFLRVRKSSPLFRLRTADDVQARVRFLNESAAVPGLIAMEITDTGNGLADLDPERDGLLVLFNATPREIRWDYAGGLEGLRLHPVQTSGADPVVRNASADNDGRCTVPAWTAAVLEAKGR